MTLGKFFMNCYQAVHFGTTRRAGMTCSWDGSRRSGIIQLCCTDSVANPSTLEGIRAPIMRSTMTVILIDRTQSASKQVM